MLAMGRTERLQVTDNIYIKNIQHILKNTTLKINIILIILPPYNRQLNSQKNYDDSDFEENQQDYRLPPSRYPPRG
jgi:hypothetical protein